jgi:choice-of-anchor B domain-containing protein
MARPLALAFSLTAALSAQGVNCRLLATRNPIPGGTPGNNNYAGMWGLLSAGRELAILPARSGTYVYDCTNPSNPVLLGSINGPSGGGGIYWRESTNFGNYVYSGSEHGATQVIDVSGATPALLGTIGSNSHTVSVDAAARRLWVNGGAGNGCRIYDLAVSATNPPQVAQYTQEYVHDCFPANGFAYLAQIFAGNVRILNTANFPTLTTVSTTLTPGQFTHNAWTNKAATVMVTADENSGGCLTVYDITNKATPIQLATWCSPAGATVHNVFLKGKVCHMSAYTAGYYAVDLSEPANPRLIASYDTSALTGSGYDGCWGCYPLQASGAIYLADMQTGFFVVEPTCGVPVDYGTGTAGTGGKVPALDYGGGFAQVGRSTFKLECTDMAPNAPLALIIGSAAATTPVLGITLNVDLASPYVQVVAGANAQGRLDVPLAIPNLVSVASSTLYVQVVTADAAGPRGLAASKGFRFTICR